MPEWILLIGKEYGPLALLVAVYTWRDMTRENRLSKRVTDLETVVADETKKLLEQCFRVIEDNTQVLQSFIRHRDRDLEHERWSEEHSRRVL